MGWLGNRLASTTLGMIKQIDVKLGQLKIHLDPKFEAQKQLISEK